VRDRTADLEASREQLRRLAVRLQAVREDERTLIAREIHDEFGQKLTGLKMDVSWLERRLDPPEPARLAERLQTMSDLIDAVIRQVRRIATELRPSVLDDMGLDAAIEWLCQDIEQRSGLACALH
jgi:signal transduction histidine kinase